MEEEVENKENFGEEEEDVEENEEENAECGNDEESTKSYVDPNAQITEGSSTEAFENGSSNW